jgi:hypothetical protein
MTIQTLCLLGLILCVGLVLSTHEVDAEPPFIKRYIPPQTIDQGELLTVDLEHFDGGCVFEDPEGNDLTYLVSTGGNIFVSTKGSIVTFSGAPDCVGSYSDIGLWAVDGDGELSEKMTLFITVLDDHCGWAPTVKAFRPEELSNIIEEGTSMTFSIIEVNWYQPVEWSYTWYVDGVAVVGHNHSALSFPKFSTENQALNTSGTYEITVELIYSEGEFWTLADWSPVWFLTVVDVNRPPTLTMMTNHQNLAPKSKLKLQVSGNDEDGDVLTYAWTYSSDLVVTEEVGTGESLVLEKELGVGVHYFRCNVSDGKDNATSHWMIVSVEPSVSPFPYWMTMVMGVSVASLFLTIAFWGRHSHSKAY